MPRDHARVNVTIWTDPDFRALPLVAQHLYFMLWTAPALSYCGVHDWRPGRLAALADDLCADDVEMIGACLEARHFIVVDSDTEEVLIRSWARFDGLMKQPRMAVSYASAYAQVASAKLRSVLVHETERIRNDAPGLTCWADKRVAEVLTHPSVSAKDLDVPNDPFRDGFTPGLAQTSGRVSTRVCTPPTPTPTPTPTPYSRTAGASADAERVGVDSDFTDWYARYPRKKAKGAALKAYRSARKKVDAETLVEGLVAQLPLLTDRPADKIPYPATWLNAESWADEPDAEPQERPATLRLTVPEDNERPPDGLSPDEWAEWDHDRRQRAAEHRAHLARERGLA